MLKVTKEEILKFIEAQPDDREVYMGDNFSNRRCGCIMIHYGKEVLNIKNRFGCGFSSWELFNNDDDDDLVCYADMDFPITDIAQLDFQGTYGELKNRLNLKN